MMRVINSFSLTALAIALLSSCDGDDPLDPSSRVETVAVIPGVLALVAGDTLRLTTIARSESGHPVSGRAVVWETSLASVVTVTTTGLVTAVSAGAAVVTATIDGKAGTAPVSVSPRFPNAIFSSVVSGGAHSCGLTSNGIAHCWGRNESGQLGVPPTVTTCLGDQVFPCSMVPVPVDGGQSFARLAGGGAFTCGLTSDGSAWCWGSNTNGQLGDGSTTVRHAPVPVATTLKFTSIAAGYEHTCALTNSGEAWCWGRNDRGALGDGTGQRRLIPVAVKGGLTFLHIAPAGPEFNGFTCGLSAAGAAWCWGTNMAGQLGRGTRDGALHPQPELVSGGLTFASIAAGPGAHACGLTVEGIAHCWGGNRAGALGDGTSQDSFLPLAVPGAPALTSLTAGGYFEAGHTCGLTSSGAAYCWGDNEVGAVGDGTLGGWRTPVAVAGGKAFASVSAGFRHNCGRTIDGTVYCWGSGRVGQLGTNTVSSSEVPVKVSGQP